MTGKLATLAIATVLAVSCGATVVPPPAGSPDTALDRTGLEPQSHDAGAVTVSATWIDGMSVRVLLDTHIVDLSVVDLVTRARVRLDGGAWVAATSWDASTDDHHRSGVLTFGTLGERAIASARVVELEVRDVGAPSHVLRWERAR